ncbi:uncharacterized protein LOC143200816 [Rhynchophorus ferrugineus]|uniref:uncharacterized protein LOC143200816 n=1 Tax=Rhynchophorus ferrugineus TaxID=354439 RepID=UPI003FCE068B
MASKFLLLFYFVIYAVSSELPTVKVLQGPGSQTSLYGPDGSSLKSSAPGGTVIADPDAPVGVAVPGPAISPSSPEIVIGDYLVGRIVTSYSLPGAAIVPAVFPKVATAPLIPAADTRLVSLLPRADGGLEGQYIPDASEALYDDGSYKEDFH